VSLTVAMNTARSSLLATSSQIAVSGKNVAGASDPTYSRKVAVTTTMADGSARVLSITRATDVAVFFRMLESTSAAASQDALLTGLDRLQETIGDTEDGQSPAALIGSLDSALQQYANAPDDAALAQAVVTAADDLASALNDATATVQQVRADADDEIAASVTRVNDLLTQFESLNKRIVAGTATGADVTSLLDSRDAILADLSVEMGIEVQTRDNNDMAIYTDSGVTLFDKSARSVTFAPTTAYAAGTVGKAVFVDGVPVTSPSATTMPLQSGKLVGLTTLRDDVAITYQTQLDEIARGLISAFAEVDSTGVDVDRAGLFSWDATDSTIPAGVTTGLAGLISVNAAVDPEQGGTLTLIRDGGVNGADYSYNASGAASFADRLQDVVTAMGTAQTFSGSTGLSTSLSLMGLATASAGWLEGKRAGATSELDYQQTVLDRTSEVLSNATGVNTDDEYALQLQLERTYQASAKLIGIVDDLYQTLFAAVG